MTAPTDPADLRRREWKAYKEYVETAFAHYVSKANDIVRQLALAGVAVIWLFRGSDTPSTIDLHPLLVWAGFLLAVTLALDLGQHIVGLEIAGNRLDQLEAEERALLAQDREWPDNPKTYPDPLPNKATEWLFRIKLLALVGAYVALISNLVTRLTF